MGLLQYIAKRIGLYLVVLFIGLSTIRTHIRAIRSKTGSDSIRAVVELIAKLPPMVGLVRSTIPASTVSAWRPIYTLQPTPYNAFRFRRPC